MTAAIFADTIKPLSEPTDNSATPLNKLIVGFPQGNIEYHPLYSYSFTEAQLFTALYEGLVSYHPLTLHPVPAVAERWSISNNKKEYTFHLRRDAYFWDGTKVIAEHFRDSWLKMLMPGNNSKYAFLLDIVEGAEQFRKGINKNPESVGIKVIDNYTLRVILNSPAEHFLKILCHHTFVPVHPSFLHKRDWSGLSSAPGNGPYYILRKTENYLLLTKNLLYWDEGIVEIPTIKILFLDNNPQENSRLFNEGKIHWLAGSFFIELIRARRHIMFNPSFATSYFFFNSRNEPWDNEILRQAFVLAAPLERIRDDNFLFFPATNLVPAIPDYPEISGFEKQNIEKALSLLKDNNLTLPEEVVIKIPDSLESRRVANLLKRAWEEIFDIKVTINLLDFQDYYQSLVENDYTIATMSWIGDFPDPLAFLQMWTSYSNLNYAGFRDSSFDAYITKSLFLMGNERYELLSKAEQKLIDSAIILPVSFIPAINLVNTDIMRGWFPNPIDIHPMKYFRFRRNVIPHGLVLLNSDPK